jgi:parvulin-like peptidyl-prolyl isomerase
LPILAYFSIIGCIDVLVVWLVSKSKANKKGNAMSVFVKMPRAWVAGCLSLMLVASLSLSGCGQPTGLLNTSQGGATVMTINGTVITKNEYDKACEQTAKQMGVGDNPEMADNGIFKEIIKQQALQQLIALSVIDQAVKKNNIQVLPQELEAKRQEIIKQVGGVSALQAIFKQNNMSEEDFNYQLKQMKQLEKLADKLGLVKGAIASSEVASFYKSHEIEFDLPLQISSAHILIKAIPAKIRADLQAKNKSITPQELEKQVQAEIEAKKKKAEDLLAEIKKAPAKFGALAERNSEDTMTQVKKGEVGFMQQRTSDPGYWKALEKGKSGELYPELVKSAYGFHIVKVGEVKPAQKKNLSQATPEIITLLEGQRRQQAIGTWLDAQIELLKKQNKLVISDDYKPSSPEEMQSQMQGSPEGQAPPVASSQP